MAASGVGAALALAAVADELPGEIVFLGTPAEERGSGKQFMIEDGLFDGLDAALLFHPCDRNHVDIEPLASVDVEVDVQRDSRPMPPPTRGTAGTPSTRSSCCSRSVGLWRQQLRPEARVHGIITEGGTAANIIPDRTVGRFMVRSDDDADFQAMQARFRQLCEAAALATEHDGRGHVLGRLADDADQPRPRRRGGSRTPPPTASPTRAMTSRTAART